MKVVKILLAEVALVVGLCGPALAAIEYPYSQAQFAKVAETGKPVLVDITASWCPVCHVQKSVINRALMSNPAYANYVILDVDFDSQKDAVRHFDATSQSTLIFFKGGKEVARLVGVTDPEVINAMMDRAAK